MFPPTDDDDDDEVFSVASDIGSEGGLGRGAKAGHKQPVEQPSPAPAVVQGGDDDFFQVSHVASIEVKKVAAKPPTSVLHRNHSQPHRTDSSSGGSFPSAGSHEEEEEDEKMSSEVETPDSEIDDDSIDNSLAEERNIIIDKSPYEADFDAEKGEKVFDEMKDVLLEDERGGPKPKAVELFGKTNASCLIRVHSLIEKSGMVWGQEWVNGNFRGNMIGKIPVDLLLLCLVPNRFVKADPILLSKLCRGTDLHNIVNMAIDEWGLERDYKLVRATTKNYSFTSKGRDCFKCAIFVARLYCCCKHSGVSTPSDRLMTKAKGCLSIMENHLPKPKSAKHKKATTKASEPISPPVSVPAAKDSASEKPQSGNKKRCRPQRSCKSPEQTLSTVPLTAKSSKKRRDDNDLDDDVKVVPVQSTASRSRRPIKTRSSSGADPSTRTMQQLISRFEEQYEEMGQRYHEMGNILEQMKEAAASSRERTEEEIRADLLEEVQRNILKSLPKK
ncbi:hypothetical protein IV203_005774 [Nitzschia inconspicua]|uniref:Uncharacterized protein n=1 Tax=Nitzschia inconspicua TaxID=303405 RepID=A0A9K3PGU5_9STRA|nr:hypothetical protein IV203_005774 [Nitzschia inconspicua]